MHAVDRPVPALYLPAAQREQLDASVAVWYLPVEHEVHALAPDPEYLPTAHASPQTMVRPVPELYFPAAQFEQLAEPVSVWYFPTGHEVQAVEAVAD